jgi:hypothetical protein
MVQFGCSIWRWLSGDVVTVWTSIMTAVALFAGMQPLGGFTHLCVIRSPVAHR